MYRVNANINFFDFNYMCDTLEEAKAYKQKMLNKAPGCKVTIYYGNEEVKE